MLSGQSSYMDGFIRNRQIDEKREKKPLSCKKIDLTMAFLQPFVLVKGIIYEDKKEQIGENK